MKDHLVNHIHKPELVSDNTLHVIGVVSNPVRYHSRYRLARQWEDAMKKTPNVKVYVVEAAFGDRHHEITQNGNPNHLQIRSRQELWFKENMINLGVQHLLPKNWKYMAWIDMDVFFRDQGWALETLHQLQHFDVVQPWSDCLDLGFHGNVLQHFKSFGAVHQSGQRKQRHCKEPYTYAHSGFAWACTRRFYENVQRLIDFAILGSADHHMAWAMINEVQHTIHQKMSKNFFLKCYEWEQQAIKVTQRQVGFVPGRIEHQFHGPKNRRYYRERWQILVDNQFDPVKDLMYDAQGLIMLIGKPKLEHAIRLYNRSRFEDSIEEF